jgi:phosphotransferase system IIB component
MMFPALKAQEGVLGVVSDFDSATVVLGARPINLKNAFTSLCQKISKKPTKLAMPEVIVIT